MARPGYYTLIGQTPVACDDLLEWARWFETVERRVRLTRVGPYFISTVFLGLDHQWGQGPPILFETMIFIEGCAGDHHSFLDYQTRTSTWLEAERDHARAVAAIHENSRDTVEQLYPPVAEMEGEQV